MHLSSLLRVLHLFTCVTVFKCLASTTAPKTRSSGSVYSTKSCERLNIISNGETPVVECAAVLYAYRANGTVVKFPISFLLCVGS